ncbi:hypothetical protein GCM10023065_26360 [Microbacterium laevaniformans]|uniref:hypothetical protein n=1 Tax=Microbacterium laevaniformans TaxID=36807 RepID=UPI001DC4BE82|nr:hypothetical protein [Microbacterium laevaniformans]MBM7753596.1 hypothetical protein [Microbacterium laevaniformans]GLJ64153.1 hypothetical protein GCM10017578_10410 [Microbacterium laevaniformans]
MTTAADDVLQPGIVERNLDRRELVRMFSIVSAEATYPGHEAHDWLRQRYARVIADYAGAIAADRAAGRINPPVGDDTALAALVITGWEGVQIRWLADDSDPVAAMSLLLSSALRPRAA